MHVRGRSMVADTAVETSNTKTQILNESLNAIFPKGYTATTVDDICQAAGVTKGSFFHHFKSKQDLAVEAARRWGAITSSLFASAPYRALPDPLDPVLASVGFL